MRRPQVSPPRFLIVYAPAMRSVAYYALCWGCSCAHLTVRRCRVGRVVVCGGVARAWAWGSSGVPLVRDRGGASMLHSGSAPRVIE